jgi:hypothetical protein
LIGLVIAPILGNGAETTKKECQAGTECQMNGTSCEQNMECSKDKAACCDKQ